MKYEVLIDVTMQKVAVVKVEASSVEGARKLAEEKYVPGFISVLDIQVGGAGRGSDRKFLNRFRWYTPEACRAHGVHVLKPGQVRRVHKFFGPVSDRQNDKSEPSERVA